MTMYRRILAVVGAVLTVAALGGFFLLKSAPEPSSWADRAQVTGYATTNASGRTSGAVSVDLDGASAARIDTIVEGLPQANLRYICAENAQEYHITFSADASKGVKRGFALTGYWCNNLVVEVPWHGQTEDRIDRDCTLLSAVRRLLPASAIATHSGTCAHANGRLFLAVSRHATRTHKARARKSPSLRPRPVPIPSPHRAPSIRPASSPHRALSVGPRPITAPRPIGPFPPHHTTAPRPITPAPPLRPGPHQPPPLTPDVKKVMLTPTLW